MFLVRWVQDTFSDLMSWFGLLPSNAKILFLGLDNAGKTTLLQMLKDDRLGQSVPTNHPHAEELVYGNRRFKAFDLGGHETARRIWRDYYADVDAIFYLVDAADRSRIEESRVELQRLFETEALRNVPFAIMGNKIDIPTACNDEELRDMLQLPHPSYGMGGGSGQYTFRNGGGPVEVFMTSIVKKTGYGVAFKWVVDVLQAKQRGDIQ